MPNGDRCRRAASCRSCGSSVVVTQAEPVARDGELRVIGRDGACADLRTADASPASTALRTLSTQPSCVRIEFGNSPEETPLDIVRGAHPNGNGRKGAAPSIALSRRCIPGGPAERQHHWRSRARTRSLKTADRSRPIDVYRDSAASIFHKYKRQFASLLFVPNI